VKAFALLLAAGSLALVTGCGGGGGETADAGASGATGASSASGTDVDAKVNARNAQVAIEVYATDNNGSYAGASPEELAKIDPSVSDADLDVVSTASSYTVSVLSESGATYSVDGGGGGEADYTCEPPGTGDCPESGDWSTS
jgi:hypothetical protein